MGTREVVDQRRITGPNLTLGDLRWLVGQCTGYADQSKLEVVGRREHGQRDVDPERIAVHGVPNRPYPADS